MSGAHGLEVEILETHRFKRPASHVVPFGAHPVDGGLRKRKPHREWSRSDTNPNNHTNAFTDANAARTNTYPYSGRITFSCSYMVSQFVHRSCELQRLSRAIRLGAVREGRQRSNDKFFRHDRTSRTNLFLRFDCRKQFECRKRNFSSGVQQRAVAEERALTHTSFQ